jgi:hypothetical protein
MAGNTTLIVDAAGMATGFITDGPAAKIIEGLAENDTISGIITGHSRGGELPTDDSSPHRSGRSERLEERASQAAAASEEDLLNARAASYNMVDFSSQSTMVEKFNTSELETSYQKLKDLADSFTENNKLAREIVYKKITTSRATSVLYGKVAVSATTSWDNNITATDNTDDLLAAITLELSAAKAAAVRLDGELTDGLTSNGPGEV